MNDFDDHELPFIRILSLQKGRWYYNILLRVIFKRGSMNSHYVDTLKSFVAKQSHFSQDVHYGALRCASCSSYHILSAILVYPFAHVACDSSDPQLIESYSRLVNWVCARQEPTGYWMCDKHQMRTNQLLLFALSKAYLLGQHLLSHRDRAGLLVALQRSIAWNAQSGMDDSPLQNSLTAIIDSICSFEGEASGFYLQERQPRYGPPLIEMVEAIANEQVEGPDCFLHSVSAIFCETLKIENRGGND